MVGFEDMITKAIIQSAGSMDLAGIVFLMAYNIFLAVLRLPFVITLITNGVLIIALTSYGVLSPLTFVAILGFSIFVFWAIRRASPFTERY